MFRTRETDRIQRSSGGCPFMPAHSTHDCPVVTQWPLGKPNRRNDSAPRGYFHFQLACLECCFRSRKLHDPQGTRQDPASAAAAAAAAAPLYALSDAISNFVSLRPPPKSPPPAARRPPPAVRRQARPGPTLPDAVKCLSYYTREAITTNWSAAQRKYGWKTCGIPVALLCVRGRRGGGGGGGGDGPSHDTVTLYQRSWRLQSISERRLRHRWQPANAPDPSPGRIRLSDETDALAAA